MFTEKRKKGLPYKSAWDTTDDPYDRKVPLLAVGEEGTPEREILVDLESKDLQAHWQSYEPHLWFVILTCALYFIFVLITY